MKGTVFLICDIYPELEIQENVLYQEWESKHSVEYIRDTLYDLGFKVEIYAPFHDKSKLLDRLTSEIKKKTKTKYHTLELGGRILFQKSRRLYP